MIQIFLFGGASDWSRSWWVALAGRWGLPAAESPSICTQEGRQARQAGQARQARQRVQTNWVRPTTGYVPLEQARSEARAHARVQPSRSCCCRPHWDSDLSRPHRDIETQTPQGLPQQQIRQDYLLHAPLLKLMIDRCMLRSSN